MTTLRYFAAALLVSALAACGDDDTGGGGGEGGSATTGTTATTTNASTGTAAAAPDAPVLDMVEPMHGALHLYWTNTTPDCDMVEGERKEDAGTFANFFSVPGTVDNEADDAATDPMVTYTYRVRCMKAGTRSPYSNEVSASPTP